MMRWSVRDVMTKDVVTVTRQTHYRDVVRVLTAHSISAVPVVDDSGRVMGVISEADVLHKMEHPPEPWTGLLQRKSRKVARAKAGAELAVDLMSSPAVTVDPTASLTSAARLMESQRLKRLPVVDQHGRLVGMVSRRDLLRVYERDDDAIREEVTDQVLRRTLWIEPDRLTVMVERGVVSLEGTVDRRSTIPLLIHLVESVAGVVEVRDHLTYHYDDTADPAGHPIVFKLS